MKTTASKKQYITTSWTEQRNISELITFAADKDFILYTHTIDTHAFFIPFIDKINEIDLIVP
jgi:hypothetical protein